MEINNCVNCNCRMPSIHFEVTIKRGDRFNRRWYVKCPNCKIRSPEECRKDLAIESWNEINTPRDKTYDYLSEDKKNKLIKLVDEFYEKAINAVEYVGASNYPSRESEAIGWVIEFHKYLSSFVKNL